MLFEQQHTLGDARAGYFYRRCFCDDKFILTVEYDYHRRPQSFCLTYDLERNPKCYQWIRGQGSRHFSVDEGDPSPMKNPSPVLSSTPWREPGSILADFLSRASEIDPAVIDLVSQNLNAEGGSSG
jgi:hypothetical protein